MIAEGADILDIGAESTRPYGAPQPVSAEDELQRLRPVLGKVAALGTPVSIDSMKSAVVAWALGAGAAVANDVWGLQRDGEMASVIAAHNAPVIVMHNRDRADPAIDIMLDIAAFFSRSLELASRAGIPASHIVLDPGIGFGKSVAHNLELLRRQPELLVKLGRGRPLLVGWSRKSTLGAITGRDVSLREAASVAAALAAVQSGARIVRVHDVAATVDALKVWQAAGLGHR
jgi:dihydropteroate synthase